MARWRLVEPGSGRILTLPAGRALILGRGPASDLPVGDPTISRRHAELRAGDDGIGIVDLGSSNGTWIEGRRVQRATLADGETIRFGRVAFRAEAGAAAEPAARPLPASETIVRQLQVSGAAIPAVAAGMGAGGDPQRVARMLALLLDVSQKLSGEFDLDRLLRTVVSVSFELLPVDRVAILLRDPHGDSLEPHTVRSRLGPMEGSAVPRSIADKVVAERVAVVTQNAAADARFAGVSIVQQSVRSAMCSPLMSSGEEVLGLLYVDSVTAEHAFSDEDLRFLVAFSGLAAAGIRNAHYAQALQRAALVRGSLERYLAPEVAARIADRPEAVAPGGERRKIAVLFCDIRGFTALAETIDPEEIASLLSEFFTEMVDVIFEHGGTLDKFIGDALMALWGAPLDDPEAARHAVEAARAMQHAIAQLDQRWSATGRPPLGAGIGINYGEMFAGNIGSHRRLDYTVIGDAVNVASRLCETAAAGEILITDAVAEALGDSVPLEPSPERALKGRRETVGVWKVGVWA